MTIDHEAKLAPHQKQALASLKNGSILWGGVGTGKSRVAAAYYVRNEAPKNIVVITTAKKRDSLDWNREFAAFAIGPDESATYYGVLTVDSWNNIAKYSGRAGCFFIFDEQRLVGNGAWVKAFLKIVKHNNWIMLSATPGDTWLDYIPVFLAHGFYKNRTEFKMEHVVFEPYTKFPKVARYLGERKLLRHRASVLVHMPYQKETIRRNKTWMCDHDDELLQKVIKTWWNPYKDRPIRNMGEMCLVMRQVVNSHPSRMDAVYTTLKRHGRLIVFYNFNYELEILRQLYGYEWAVAEWNGHRHEEIPDTDKWLYLVQYSAGSEGWNCTETDAMFFYSLTYSYKHFCQAFGRIDRMNTLYLNLWYYIARSKTGIDTAIWRSLSAKKSFNSVQFSIAKI